MRFFLFLVIGFFSLSSFAQTSSFEEILGKIPVQDGGRVKPFDTFARESLQLLYGKSKYKEKSASEIVMTWLLLPEHWEETEFVVVDRKDLKETLGLKVDQKYFSPNQIMTSDKISLVMQDLANKQNAQEKLNPYWQAVQTLNNQVSLFKSIVVGAAIKMAPRPEGNNWYELREMPPELRMKFDDIARNFVESIKNGDTSALGMSVTDFINTVKVINPTHYASLELIEKEIQYNRVHPFMWSWALYLVSALLFGTYFLVRKNILSHVGILTTVVALIIHSYGFYLRMMITGRPPVSNMYESVIWVSWGAIVFALLLERYQKKYFYLFSANIVSVLCLIVADMAPNVLDPSLQPLQPVLRSNMWLTVHVLTITLSYSVLFLAFVLGDIGLIYYLRGETKHQAAILNIAQAIYRSMQVGVILLFAGTVLGGVWADYSWGRFWGWDPKETWALIAFLGYMAILHGRIAGWLKNFGFVASSVVAFSLVLMAWYGVNFVLGAGLHSYGFGAGGVEYVAAFVAIHIAFTVAVITVRQARLKKHA